MRREATRWLGAALLGALALGGAVEGLGEDGAEAEPETEAPIEAASEAAGGVGYAHLSGTIDRLRHRYLDRAIDDAREQGLDTVIVHIDTDGGEVSHAREMFKKVIDQPREGLRMIAYVDFRAISAGAMIAYAHEEVYVAETASIGDIGVIFINREGKMEYAPEKIETVVRSLLVQAAEQNGWDRALLLKMTARNQKLYRAILAEDETRYVIEDDLPDFLLEHPEFDPDDERRLVLYRGEDRLLTLTGREALSMGMATGEAESIEALYSTLGIDPETVTDLTPRGTETTAWFLSTFAPLLAGLAFLFILFELNTPGVGWWALIAGALGGTFLLAQYYLDFAENIEVLLLIAGIALIAVEFLTVAGGGFIGVAGGALALVALIMLFLPNEMDFDFANPEFMDALGSAVGRSFIALGVVAAGAGAFFILMPRSPLRRRFALASEITGTSSGAVEARAPALVGRRGHTPDGLHPGGTVFVDGEPHSARAEHGAWIAPGASVEVLAVEFGEVLVRERTHEEPAARP